MRVKTLRFTIAALLAVSGWVLSQEVGAQDVLKAKGCLNCHDAEKKKVGPSIKILKAKGIKSDEAVAKMVSGKGHPKVKASEADIKAAVEQMTK
jgi:cytochrome c551/c552